MYDMVIVGSGIGAAGLLSKIDVNGQDVCMLTLDESYRKKYLASEEKFEYEYLVRKNRGNIHDWGGVLTLSNYVLDNYEDDFYTKALSNYYSFSNQFELTSHCCSELLKVELTPKEIAPNLYHRKLLISNRKLLDRNMETRISQKGIQKLSAKVDKFEKVQGGYVIHTNDGVILKTKKIALCAGAIGTRDILIKSGYIEDADFSFGDGKFGRIGRIRFDKSLPFGFFHHHLISKMIRFKTGFEIKNENTDVMFFLQPAIKGIPASEIHLLKEFLNLKANFSLGNIWKFISSPKAIMQILLMEFSILNKTTDFDVYCIADFGKKKMLQDDSFNIDDINKNISKAYLYFTEYLKKNNKVDFVDHDDCSSIDFNSLESSIHMCGTVGYDNAIKYDVDKRLYTLHSDDNIIINDNSIITDKGIANPSIQLF